MRDGGKAPKIAIALMGSRPMGRDGADGRDGDDGDDGDGKSEAPSDDEIELAGALRRAKSDEEYALALKEFIESCMEEYGNG